MKHCFCAARDLVHNGRLTLSGFRWAMQDAPIPLLRFEGAVRHDPAVDRWFENHPIQLADQARRWFEVMRSCGDDVRELLHDGHPTACIGDAAFGYVNAFTAHVNVGFFLGAWLEDPSGLLQGSGKRMRHVKLRPDQEVDEHCLTALIECAHRDMRERLAHHQRNTK